MRYWNGPQRPASRSIRARLSALNRHNISTFPVAATRERTMSMSVYKRGGRWHFTKTVDGVRYRGALKTARLKSEAEEDEREIIRQIRRGEYGNTKRSKNFKEFAEKVYIPACEESDKKSLRIVRSRLKALLAFFGK